jgi:hypothetical protein
VPLSYFIFDFVSLKAPMQVELTSELNALKALCTEKGLRDCFLEEDANILG